MTRRKLIFQKEFLNVYYEELDFPDFRVALYWEKFRFGYKYLCSLNEKDIEKLIEQLKKILEKRTSNNTIIAQEPFDLITTSLLEHIRRR